MYKRMWTVLLALCLALTLPGAMAGAASLELSVFDPGFGVSADSLTPLEGGGLLLCGFAFDNEDDPTAYAPYMAAFDANGQVRWERRGDAMDGVVLCRALGILPGGLAAVQVRTSDEPADWVIEHIDADGNTALTIGPGEGGVGALSRVQDGYLAGGYAMQYSSTQRGSMTAQDGFALLDGDLKTVWSQVYDDMEGSLLTFVDEAADGYVVGGFHQHHENSVYRSRAMAIKLGKDGALLWRFDGQDATGFQQVNGICALSDGGALFTYESDPSAASRDEAPSTLTRLDGEGNIVFSQHYDTDEETLILASMARLSDGRYVVLGLNEEHAQRLLFVDEGGGQLDKIEVTAPEGLELSTLRFATAPDGAVWAYALARPIPAEGAAEPSALEYQVVFGEIR